MGYGARMKRGIFVAVPLLLFGACGSDGPQGNEAAVEKAAQEQADRFSSGDYAGAYDMWVADAREAVSKDDYLAWADACSTAGAPIDVTDVRLEDDTEATVRLGVGGLEQSYKMRLEGDEWSWVPNNDSMALYEAGECAGS